MSATSTYDHAQHEAEQTRQFIVASAEQVLAEHGISLGKLASEIERIRRAHAVGAEYDAGFDSGEFSRPSHWRMERREICAALLRAGIAPHWYDELLDDRIGPDYAAKHALHLHPYFDDSSDYYEVGGEADYSGAMGGAA